MTTIDTTNRTTYPLVDDFPAAKVWTKPTWADSWTLRNDLIPIESNFTVGQTQATATLHYRYGRVMVPGTSTFSTLTRITTRGYYVLIAWGTHDGNPIYWLGYAESPIDGEHHPARNSLPEAGVQMIPCFGLVRALQECYITSTVYLNPDYDSEDPESEELLRSYGGATFNYNAQMKRHFRRTDAKKNFTGDPVAYAFEIATDAGEKWSSRDIIEHLMAFHVPTVDSVVDSGGIPWELANKTVIPDWDYPDIETDGRSVADIITEICNPSRMLNWTVGVDATFIDPDTPPTINALQVYPFTTTPDAIDLPSSITIPANTQTIVLTCDTDPHTTANVTKDESEVVDQVVVRGPLEIGVGTFKIRDPDLPFPTGEFEPAWSSETEDEYAEGASGEVGFADLEQWQKRDRNDKVRRSGKFDAVFSRFHLWDDWNGEVDNNETPAKLFEPVPPVPPAVDPTTYKPYPKMIVIEEELTLRSGVDYSGDPTLIDEPKYREKRKPLILFADPNNAGKYILMEDVAGPSNGQNVDRAQVPKFTISAKVFAGYRHNTIEFRVNNGPAHVIAGPDFSGVAGDTPQERYGDFDYRDIEMTLSIRGDRRPFVEVPESSELSLDVVRRKIFTIDHESLELVHIAAGTKVGIGADGDPITSDGGLLRDPSTELSRIATMLASYYLNPRNRATIRTGWRLSAMKVGSILESVSTWGTVDAPIIEISISNPLYTGSNPGAPSMRIVAAANRFDPMALIAATGFTR